MHYEFSLDLFSIFSFACLIELALYLVGSFGLYSMANNTGMKNPWLAWIPIARDYLLGSLADRYNCTSCQKKTSFSIWLAVLSAVQLPLTGFFLAVILILLSLMYLSPLPFLMLLFLTFLLSVVRIAYTVFYLLSFYYVTMDYEPSRSVLYTILSFFDIGGILLFLMRRNVPVGVAGRCEPLQPKYNVH